MEETKTKFESTPGFALAKSLANQLDRLYQDASDERRIVHDLSFEINQAMADECLFLIETPVSSLAGIVDSFSSPITARRATQLREALQNSPLANRHAAVQWLRGRDLHALADYLQLADYQRLLLSEALGVSPATALRSAS